VTENGKEKKGFVAELPIPIPVRKRTAALCKTKPPRQCLQSASAMTSLQRFTAYDVLSTAPGCFLARPKVTGVSAYS